MLESLIPYVTGAISGLLYGGTVYFKKRDPKKKFDLKKIAPTLVIGAIAGVMLASQGLAVTGANLESSIVMLTGAGFTVIVENLLKKLYRK